MLSRADDALPNRKLRAAQKEVPLAAQTARAIGDVQVRNRGTIGGSLSNADPARLAGGHPRASRRNATSRPEGERTLGAEEFFSVR